MKRYRRWQVKRVWRRRRSVSAVQAIGQGVGDAAHQGVVGIRAEGQGGADGVEGMPEFGGGALHQLRQHRGVVLDLGEGAGVGAGFQLRLQRGQLGGSGGGGVAKRE